MKPEFKRLLMAGAMLALCHGAEAANIPLSSLTPRGTPQSTDLMPILPVGGSVLQSVTVGDLLASAGSGTVSEVVCGAGLSGGTITTTGTCANAGVLGLTAGSGITLSGSLANETITATGSGSVTSIVAGTGLTGGTITGAGTIALGSIIAAGSIVNPGTITYNAEGQITAASGSGGSGTVTKVVAGTCLTGGTITTSGTIGIDLTCAPTPPAPQGRLTLSTGTPVMITNVTNGQTIYYDCYAGRLVPIYDGTEDTAMAIGSCEISDTVPTSSTGVANASGVFDEFAVNVSGTLTLCHVTNGSGGGWASDTSGSNTARGTGYSALHMTRGYWTNSGSISHCYNGGTDEGSISADGATYLGSFYTTAAGKTSMQFTIAGASGGSAPCLCLWNAYNRVPQIILEWDTNASWTYALAAWESMDASTSNRFSWVDGLAQSPVTAILTANGAGGAAWAIGATLDSASGNPLAAAQINGTTEANLTVMTATPPVIGIHYEQAVQSSLTTSTSTLYGSGTSPTRQFMSLQGQESD